MAPDPATDTPIRITLNPEFDEYFRFNLWLVFRRLKLLIPFAVLAVIVYLCSPFLFERDRSVAALYLGTLPLLILPALVFLLIPATMFWAARQRWRTVPELREPKTYTFSETGIQATGETFDGFASWQLIISADQVGGQVLLGTGQQVFYLVPIRAFKAPEDFARFKRLVEAKVQRSRL